MATLIPVLQGTQDSALKEVQKTHKTLSGGLDLPEGIHQFTVASKKAFGILQVNETWALPVVAGSMKVEGKTVEFVLSDQPGAKTLVIPDIYFTQMRNEYTYNVTIGTRKGRKVVTMVEEGSEENVIDEAQVAGSGRKRHKEATL